MNLTDRVAVVTGASSGLGLAFARALCARGARVYGLARRAGALAALEDTLGPAFRGLPADVTDPDAVAAAFDTITAGARRLDVLVNNAGLGRFGPADALPLAEWDAQMNTNLRGVFLCTRAALPVMKRQNAETGFGGHIVNVASVAGLVGNPQLTAYNATKFGLRGFSEALMKEVREDGIRVTCLYPGSVGTPFFAAAGVTATPNPLHADDVAATLLHVLEAPDNCLISEVVLRPLRPRG